MTQTVSESGSATSSFFAAAVSSLIKYTQAVTAAKAYAAQLSLADKELKDLLDKRTTVYTAKCTLLNMENERQLELEVSARRKAREAARVRYNQKVEDPFANARAELDAYRLAAKECEEAKERLKQFPKAKEQAAADFVAVNKQLEEFFARFAKQVTLLLEHCKPWPGLLSEAEYAVFSARLAMSADLDDEVTAFEMQREVSEQLSARIEAASSKLSIAPPAPAAKILESEAAEAVVADGMPSIVIGA